MNRIAALVLLIGLSMSSLYIFPSGQPQPADFILLGFAGMMLVMYLKDEGNWFDNGFVLSWLFLVIWVAVVCSAWVIVRQNPVYFDYLRFFVFNFLIGMAVIRILVVYPPALAIIRFSVMFAVFVSGVYVAADLGAGVIRATGSFNNPNQLAYYSLCAVIIVLASYDFKLPMKVFPVACVIVALVSVLSASSLGAITGVLSVLLAWMLANFTKIKKFIKVVALVPVIAFAVVAFDTLHEGQMRSNFEARMDVAPKKVERIYEDRKYDRIGSFYEYTLLGAGEGDLRRFYSDNTNTELHSTFGTLLFSYGVPGLSLFIMIIYMTLRRAPFYVWVAMSGPMLYSISHQGLRTTLFWIMLVVIWHLYSRKKDDRAQMVSRPGGEFF